MDLYDSSDEEVFDSLFGRMDLRLGRPSLRRAIRRRSEQLFVFTDAANMLDELVSTLMGNGSDELDMECEDSIYVQRNVLCNPMSLLELSAQAVAKHCSCSVLEQHSPPLDEQLLRKVAFWAFPQDIYRVRAFAYLTDRLVNWRRAVSLVKEEKIKEMWQVGFMATAYLVKYGQQAEARTSGEIRVSLVFEQQKILGGTCSECKNDVWCEHIIAACVYRIRYANKVKVHAPMTETLSTLNRSQLQKLVQYAVQEDPAGILGKVFKHLVLFKIYDADDIRDTSSEKSLTEGAPDPTFGGLHGDKSQWQLSLELLDKRLKTDLDSMIRTRSFFDFSEGRSTEYYPDIYDVSVKMQARFFSYVTPILELARQEEYVSAAEVMTHLALAVVTKMSSTPHVDCPSLSRLWHDLCRIYSLLLLKTDDQAARALLNTTTDNINRMPSVRDRTLEMSQWAELPSLCTVFTAEVAKITTGSLVMVEPVVAKLVSCCPKELTALLEGTEPIDKCLYEEDVVIMIARLELVFFFEFKKTYQKFARLAFVVLHRLAILAQDNSILGAYLPLSVNVTASSSSSSSCSSSSRDSSVSALLSALQSSPVAAASTVNNKSKSASVPLKQSGKSKSTARMSTGGKNPAKRFKKNPANESITRANLSHGQIAYAMLYIIHQLIVSKKITSFEPENRKLLVGFCLQALEMSRHRTSATTPPISQLEQDWLLKLETTICDFLMTVNGSDASDAVSTYIVAISSVGTDFYLSSNGSYPLVLLEMLCHLCTKNEELKTSKGCILVQICSEILLNSSVCLDKVVLPELRSFDLLFEVITDSGSYSNQRKHREFAIRKFHVITETFLSLLRTDKIQDIELLVKILNHFQSIKTVPLLTMISKDMRMHVWRFKEEPQVIEAMLRFSIHAYHESLALKSLTSDGKRHESVEREFIFNLARRLGVQSLRIFSETWQSIFSCKDLEELILFIEPKSDSADEQAALPGEMVDIIMRFYDAKSFHDEDSCRLLTRFFKAGDAEYSTVISKIIANSANFHAGALFQLAQLQQAQKRGRKDSMDDDVFFIIEKALDKITQVTPKLLEYIDWMFTSCVNVKKREPAKSPYVSKVVEEVCRRVTCHPEILLRLLQNMEQCQPSLSQHPSTVELGSALIIAYREYFLNRLRECGHAAYASVVSEMQRARLECKHYIKNGEVSFDSEVVENVRRSHHTKKKLIKLMQNEFQLPGSAK